MGTLCRCSFELVTPPLMYSSTLRPACVAAPLRAVPLGAPCRSAPCGVVPFDMGLRTFQILHLLYRLYTSISCIFAMRGFFVAELCTVVRDKAIRFSLLGALTADPSSAE